MEAYPVELKEAPCPLVAALGPKEIQARILPVLRSINEEFAPKLHLTSLSYEHRFAFPTKKDKPATTPPPRGILKARWLKKHHEILPSVLLLFYAFEPRLATRDWAIQETVIRDEVEDLRRSLSGRECKILLVLVQLLDDGPSAASASSSSSSMMVNHANSDDRLLSLRKRAELDAKSVWLLKDVARTNSQLIKLELAIRTNAIEYYKAQAKRVKRTKKPHRALAVRHSFKIAHYYEFRKYTSKMLVHYEAAYKALLAMPPTSDMQIKHVAEYIHFKLVYHAIFSNHNLKAAVDQLQRHMTAFARSTTGYPYLHWAWVSRQYHVFGQLVLASQSMGVTSYGGLESDLYKEAYLYFSAAAKYATWRRKAAGGAQLKFDPMAPPPPPPPAILFVGEVDLEHASAVEKTVPHAVLAIELLGQAIAQVQVHLNHRYRLKHRLMLRLGMEHVANGEYAIARAELEKAKTAYIQERWYAQVSQVLRQLLACVEQQQDATAFLDYSLQLLSPKLDMFVHDRVAIQERLFRSFHDDARQTPPPELALDALKNVLSVYVDFKQPKAYVRESIDVTVTVESFLPSPITLHALALVFSPDGYNQVLEHDTANLTLLPHTPQDYVVRLTLQASPGKLQCQQVRFLFRNNDGVQWMWTASSFTPMPLLLRRNSLLQEMEGVIPGMGQGAGSPSFQRRPTSNSLDYEDVDLVEPSYLGSQLLVVQPRARATVDLLCSQVLVGDLTPLRFVLSAHQDTIETPQVAVSTASSDVLLTYDSLTSQLPETDQAFVVWLKCASVHEVTLAFHLTYETALGVHVSLETSFVVHVVPPFALDTSLYFTYPCQDARVGQAFSVVGRLTSTAAVQLRSIQMVDATAHATFPAAHGLDDDDAAWTMMGAGDQHSFHLRVQPHTVAPSHALGRIAVLWATIDEGKPETVVRTELPLPHVPFVSVPLSVDLNVPEYGMEGAVASCELVLTNHTMHLVAVTVRVASESDFVVSGLVDGKLELLPLETLVSGFGLIPMHPGHLKLPTLELVHCESKESVISSDQRLVLYVVPHGHQL
ncbi:Aste57867_14202 [Aphanomyces stellatus]|uniref:Aste57867_14202 protein n=1 Tax=Aphanomyces stellatus TaxID=120398 RepID=A0A485L0Z1_9STRA|nr:hypothetical protein As57867_014151 [Aphanomyces stellatus]VFT91027.1 Aste57867_14202 [Aphanomyces stellatus]